MPHTSTRALSVGMAMIMAVLMPLWCCCSVQAAQAATPATAETHPCHGSPSAPASETHEIPSPASHCPFDTSGDDCPHHQVMASAADDAFLAPSGISYQLPVLQLLPAFIFDTEQMCPVIRRYHSSAELLVPVAGTLRAQHVLLLI